MRIAVVSAALFLSGSAAFAAGTPGSAPPKPQGDHGPCFTDVKRFCDAVPFGDGRRIACLAKHQKQLTPACQERVPKMQAMFEFGQQQLKKTQALLAKQEAAEAKKKAARPTPPAPK
jgi:hypothetical protein